MLSRPSRARGLKLANSIKLIANQVASFTGAWIETLLPRKRLTIRTSRPSRARGLKPQTALQNKICFVASFTGAWIETGNHGSSP